MASLVVEGFSEGNMKGVDYPAEGAAQETQEHPVEIAEDYLAIFRPFIEKAKVCGCELCRMDVGQRFVAVDCSR